MSKIEEIKPGFKAKLAEWADSLVDAKIFESFDGMAFALFIDAIEPYFEKVPEQFQDNIIELLNGVIDKDTPEIVRESRETLHEALDLLLDYIEKEVINKSED